MPRTRSAFPSASWRMESFHRRSSRSTDQKPFLQQCPDRPSGRGSGGTSFSAAPAIWSSLRIPPGRRHWLRQRSGKRFVAEGEECRCGAEDVRQVAASQPSSWTNGTAAVVVTCAFHAKKVSFPVLFHPRVFRWLSATADLYQDAIRDLQDLKTGIPAAWLSRIRLRGSDHCSCSQ